MSLTRRSARAATLGAVGALLLAGLPAASAEVRTPARTTDDVVVRNCATTIDGEKVRIRLRVVFESPTSNDVKRVAVRATDNGESGAFRNGDTNLTQIKVRITNTRGKSVTRSAGTSPFTVVAQGAGINDVRSVTAAARWRIDGERSDPVSCFFLDD